MSFAKLTTCTLRSSAVASRTGKKRQKGSFPIWEKDSWTRKKPLSNGRESVPSKSCQINMRGWSRNSNLSANDGKIVSMLTHRVLSRCWGLKMKGWKKTSSLFNTVVRRRSLKANQRWSGSYWLNAAITKKRLRCSKIKLKLNVKKWEH